MTEQTSLAAENERLRQLNMIYRDALAFAGHEWQNQISLLSLAVTVLRHEAGPVLDEHQKKIVARIDLCAAALHRIARGFFSLSQAERESFPIQPVFVDPIREIMTPAIFSFTDLLKESGQTCLIQESQPTPLVWADREMLAVVYDNLIGNAIKYGERGGKIVLNVLERGQVDELSVWNSGPGISSEQIKRLSDPFATSAGSTDPWVDGLGLYISRRIIEAHGGTMTIESRPGTGVKLIFTLPKHRVTGGYRV